MDILQPLNLLFFLSIIFGLYWIFPHKWRALILLLASYFFYVNVGQSIAGWTALGLIVLSTLINYFAARTIFLLKRLYLRKFFLALTIILNIAFLGVFKYFDFLAATIINILRPMDIFVNLDPLNWLLPIGISFYTFRVLSYNIDVYNKKIEPARSLVDFSLYVAYFPSILAGPIERTKDFLTKLQLEKRLKEIRLNEGIYFVIYGLFQKIILADTLAPFVKEVYSSSQPSGALILLATYAFAIQIYGDFAGYTNIARGISLFFGIDLVQNFNLPYLATNPADFWKRWHITLSTWVKDYMYISLGGKYAPFFALWPLLASWVVMGLWHGAAWNYVLWGLYWFALIYGYRILKQIFPRKENSWFSKKIIGKAVSRILFFQLVCYGWLIFRSSDLHQIISFTHSLLQGVDLSTLLNIQYLPIYAVGLFLVIYEAFQNYFADQVFITKKNFYYQLLFYLVLFFLLIEIKSTDNVLFLYFQF